jgi:glycosyltransferase involved in cell wall biosynthesis
MINFSVLMSIYYKEKTEYLTQCLKSLERQTLPPTEIIIVKDGRLTDELEMVLLAQKEKLPLKIVGYEENKGLTYALNYGLQFCSYELVARMDSDDICLHDRFEKQIKYFEQDKNIVLLSGAISEFNKKPCDIFSIRKVPKGNDNIIKYMKKRNAFNHMAVMFRKTAILNVGSYAGVNGFEDYDLWIRLVQNGYLVDNLQDTLVYVRIGNNMIGRRSGLDYSKREIEFLYVQKKRKFISNYEFMFLILIRIPLRLIPSKLISIIYFNFLR